jgi:CO/xanthine dehydrogenase Mo-binding subunit
MMYGIGYGFNRPDIGSTRIEVAEDGTATLYSGACEIGQGVATILCQMVAEGLGINYTDVRVVLADTGSTPDSGPTSASRATYVQGNAVLKAAADVRCQMAEAASEILGCTVSELVFKEGQVYCEAEPRLAMSFKELSAQCHQRGKRCIGYSWHDITTRDVDPETSQGDAYATYAWATQLAEVEVDTETGQVRVVRLASATDAGKAINPQNVEGQIEGGAVMGIGYAVYEDYVVSDKGVPLTYRLSSYRVPTSMDVPDVDSLIVEVPEPTGPFGAKGIAEPASIPTAPAILNAIYDAVGIRITELPVTPEKVLAALDQRSNKS